MAEKKPVVKESAMTPKYGEWAFLLGVLLALIVGLFSTYLPGMASVYILAVMVLLGFVVGFLNVSEKETMAFLIATIALLSVISSWGPVAAVITTVATQVGLGTYGALLVAKLANVLAMLASFVAPAALIVALKQIYELAAK
ncbi:MAG: hypothetical protein V1492_05735 [Candidatus Micrarchaeota archaeon]